MKDCLPKTFFNLILLTNHNGVSGLSDLSDTFFNLILLTNHNR